MLSVFPILAMTMALQAPPSEAAPPMSIDAAIASSAAEDPIDALMRQAETAPPPAPAPAPDYAPPPQPRPAPPVARYTPAPPPMAEDDEEAAEALLPSGPQPYATLPGNATVRPNYTLFNNPVVWLPPKSKGMLDGGWVLARTDGRKLYSFQFNDTGGGAEVEGAWRNLDLEWSTLGSGPVESVGYQGAGVTIRFFEKDRGGAAVVNLQRTASGDWAGELQSRNGPAQVVMRRN